MPQIDISDDLLRRLNTVAKNDYQGASMEQTLERLLSEHQEYVVLEAAAEQRQNVSDAD